MSVGIVVGTFGDDTWRALARERALPSTARQTRLADQVVHVHAATLHEARNIGLEDLTTEWVIHLDADDELDPRYVEQMLLGEGDLRQPSTLGVYEDGTEDDYPVLIPQRPLHEANYIVIGGMVRRQLAVDVGGFRDLSAFEDWDLWARCWIAGAVITSVPTAIYRVHVRADSRNTMNSVNADTYNTLRREHTMAARERGLI